MQVRCRRPDVPQRRDVDARQRTAEAIAAVCVDRADVLRVVAGARREGGATVAARAVLRDEDIATGAGCGSHRAVGVPQRARRKCRRATSRRRQARRGPALTPAFGSPSGWLRVPVLNWALVMRPLPPARVRICPSKSWTSSKLLRPVQESLAACTAVQVRGVAQPLAEARQVPHAAVLTAIVVAGGAAEVGVASEPRVDGVIEEPLALQHSGAQLLGSECRRVGDERQARDAFGLELRRGRTRRPCAP